MDKTKIVFFRLTPFFFCLILFLSCNNSGEVPCLEKELGIEQPTTVPLVFTPSKNLTWDTVKLGTVSPVIKLDIGALPAMPYDSTGFKPFKQAQVEVRFDFNSLPQGEIDLDKLPSKPLDLKPSLLAPGAVVKAGRLSQQKGKPLSIYDFGQAQGLQTNFVGTLMMITVSTKKIGNKVEVRVEDNGNGIPQKVVDKIFQPFFTTKPSGHGTGLGLSLSYDIVKAHGGEIKVETREGEGSQFIILLPKSVNSQNL